MYPWSDGHRNSSCVLTVLDLVDGVLIFAWHCSRLLKFFSRRRVSSGGLCRSELHLLRWSNKAVLLISLAGCSKSRGLRCGGGRTITDHLPSYTQKFSPAMLQCKAASQASQLSQSLDAVTLIKGIGEINICENAVLRFLEISVNTIQDWTRQAQVLFGSGGKFDVTKMMKINKGWNVSVGPAKYCTFIYEDEFQSNGYIGLDSLMEVRWVDSWRRKHRKPSCHKNVYFEGERHWQGKKYAWRGLGSILYKV